MGEPAAFVLLFIGQTEPALVESGRDHHGAAGVTLALGGLDSPRAVAGQLHDLAEAQFDSGDSGVVGHQRGHLGAAEDLVEVVQFAEVDQQAAGRKLVEAKRLEAGTRGFGGGGQARRPSADDDEIERGGIHCGTNRFSGPEVQVA